MAVSPNRAPEGTEVTVRVGNWAAGPVEVRWGSAQGSVLNTAVLAADNDEVLIPVVIPERSSPGRYALVVVHGPSQMATPFVVTTTATATGDTATGEPSSSEVSKNGPAPAPTPAATAGPVAADPGATASPAPSGSPAATGPGATVATPGLASSTRAPVPAANAATAAPAAQRTGRSSTVASGPLPVAAGGAAAAATPGPAGDTQTPAAAGVPSASSAGDDPWSGLAGTEASPVLLVAPAASGGGPSGGAVVAGVLVLSLVALAGGFALAELRRRG